MGLFEKLKKGLLPELITEQSRRRSNPPQTTVQRRRSSNPPRQFRSHEEIKVYEQEQSGIKWHGVPLSELSKLAQTVYHGKYVDVDQWGFLVFHFSSTKDKTVFSVQCSLDENAKLRRMTRNYYPGQWQDSADFFIEKANQRFTFRK